VCCRAVESVPWLHRCMARSVPISPSACERSVAKPPTVSSDPSEYGAFQRSLPGHTEFHIPAATASPFPNGGDAAFVIASVRRDAPDYSSDSVPQPTCCPMHWPQALRSGGGRLQLCSVAVEWSRPQASNQRRAEGAVVSQGQISGVLSNPAEPEGRSQSRVSLFPGRSPRKPRLMRSVTRSATGGDRKRNGYARGNLPSRGSKSSTTSR
jgi:hypothetical protein